MSERPAAGDRLAVTGGRHEDVHPARADRDLPGALWRSTQTAWIGSPIEGQGRSCPTQDTNCPGVTAPARLDGTRAPSHWLERVSVSRGHLPTRRCPWT